MVDTLRPYQKSAYDAVLAWIKSSVEPCVIEAPTGSGKSHIIAAIAQTIHRMSKKRVVCIAPSAELVMQNHSKYLLTGNPASIYSASIRKCLKHFVVFVTPLSIKNKVVNNVAAIIIDEAHGITPTIMKIIANHRDANPNLRVIGMTATPYRLGTGYIYANDIMKRRKEECAIDPYFSAKVHSISAYELLQSGYLTKPVVGEINADNYDTSKLIKNSMGKYTAESVDRAFVGMGRKTSGIINDIVMQASNRMGVIIFASTVRHAEECLSSLPESISALITAGTPKGERQRIIKAIKSRQIKYIVNVSVLTTGFDAPHIDVVAILRATESVGLLQQIIGRGLRLHPDKKDALILDYAENIDRHCPDGDVFDPQIKTAKQKGDSEKLDVTCPLCDFNNEFSLRYNPDGYGINAEANWSDLEGNEVNAEDGDKVMPAHYGRRCFGLVGKRLDRCTHRWVSKECPECDADNDIAARYCMSCKGEIIDPNKKLIRDFRLKKKDVYQKQIDEVLAVKETLTVTRKGDPMERIEFTTGYRNFTLFLLPKSRHPEAIRNIAMYKIHRGNIKTVTYHKNSESGFYKVEAYNEVPDMA